MMAILFWSLMNMYVSLSSPLLVAISSSNHICLFISESMKGSSHAISVSMSVCQGIFHQVQVLRRSLNVLFCVPSTTNRDRSTLMLTEQSSPQWAANPLTCFSHEPTMLSFDRLLNCTPAKYVCRYFSAQGVERQLLEWSDTADAAWALRKTGIT